MKYRSLTASAFFALSTALADDHSTHEHGHAHHSHGDHFAFGSPGKENEVSRIIRVEANDAMRFVHEKLDIRPGETIKFMVKNVGHVRHELSIGDRASQREHAEMMKVMPGMVHNDPNAVTLEPGETKQLVWKFDKLGAGKIEFACHEPGHYEAGMLSFASLTGPAISPTTQHQDHGEHHSHEPGEHHSHEEHHSHGGHHSHEGISWTMGDWKLMAHGVLKGIYTNQGGPRGDELTFLSGDFGLMAQRQLGPGTLGLTAMLTPDPLMGKRGYPLLLQTGETADGRTPLVDRQHPHDLFMELSASYRLPLSQDSALSAYFGWPGEPALGPPAPDHRFSGAEIPETPISHHWLDSTHVSFGVATLGYSWRNWRIEGSLFNGREPDQNRWNIESDKFDSTSIRLSFSPNENWAFQVSHGFLKEPRQLFPGIDTDRTTVSATYHVKSTDTEWATTFAWGRNNNKPGNATDAFLLESTFKLRDTHTFFGRAERVEKDELFFGDHPLTGRAFTVNKLALGYIYDFPKWGHLQWGIGVSGSIHFLPSELENIYTAFPLGGVVFLRAKIK